MDQESALPSGGSYISLNENEQRYYSGLHTVCQADSSGKLSAGKVGELFKTSQLPPEALHQVTEVCGAKRLGCFGTAQFYVALKLLSAAQCGLPISLESVTANLPLPVFVGFTTEQDLRRGALPQSVDAQQGLPDGAASLPGAWPLAEKRGGLGHPEGNTERKERWPPAQPPGMTPPRSPPLPRNYPHAVARNDMDAHIANESKHSTRPIIQQDLHSSPSNYRTKAAPELSAVSRASVAAVDYSDEDDAWRITAEQREYYTNQFITLQPDLGALVLGTVARNFFTKSKLPIPELSHIWELSDVDRDGALTFSEFCTAFHLIVARKNGYPLPDTLPPTLQPGFIEHDADFSDTPGTTEPLIVFEDADFSTKQMDRNIVERVKPALPKLKQEIKLESDFSSRRCETSQDKRTEPHQDPDPQLKTRTRPRSYSSTSIDDAMKKAEVPPTPPPRPQKTHSRASSLDLNKLLQQGGPGVKGSWLPPPPALPPRPSASQVPLFISAAEKTPVKKAQQPYFADFSRFREEEEIGPDHRLRSRLDGAAEDLASTSKPDMGVPHHRVPQKPVRRKYHQDGQNPEATPPSTASLAPPTKPAQKLLSKRKREIQMAIRQNKETNAVLTRLNSELQQQLKEVHRERITLESQLELLRPLAST